MKYLQYWRTILILNLLLILLGGGLSIIDVKADPPGFTPASIRFEDEVLFVEIYDSYAYVALTDDIVILDISHPVNPIVRGSIEGSGLLAVSDGFLYVLTLQTLNVFDLTAPVYPKKVGEINTQHIMITDMVILETYAYITDWNGLIVVDVSDPTEPRVISEFSDQGFLRGIDVVEDLSGPTPKRFAYLTGEPDHVNLTGGGFRIVDVTDPTTPQIVYPCLPHVPDCRGAFGIQGVEVAEPYAYVVYTDDAAQIGGIEGRRGLNIWDVSVSESPVLISALEMPTAAYHVAVHGNRAFVSSDEGLHTIDVSNPTQLRQVGLQRLEVAGSRARVAAAGACVYAAEGARGLRILCETNITPTPPSLVYMPMVQAAG